MSSLLYLTLATLATSAAPSLDPSPPNAPPAGATLEIARPIEERDPPPLTDPPSYARMPWAVSFAAHGHMDCVWQRQPCRSGSSLLTLLARRSGFFAWQFNLGHSSVSGDRPAQLTLFAAGARLHALDDTALDPFVGLKLGAEYVSQPTQRGSFNLATELTFGVTWLVAEGIGIGPTLSFRQGFRRITSCSNFGGCGSWYSQHDRWVALGLELSLGFGQPL